MKLPAQKIETSAAKRDVRYYLEGAWLDIDKARLVTTDGNILTSTPVELDETDVSGIIPADAISHARKTKSEHVYTDVPDAPGEPIRAIVDGAAFPLIDAKYPDVDSVIPERGEVTISLDLTLLERIRKSLFAKTGPTSTCRVRLCIKDNLSAVRVEPCESDSTEGAFAVVMPCRT